MSRLEEALRVFWKLLVTSTIPMVRFYVVETIPIIQSVGDDRNVEDYGLK